MSGKNSTPGRRRFGRFILRLVVTGAAVAVILWRIDAADIGRAIGRISAGAVLGSLGLCVLANMLAAFRWQTLLHAAGVKASWLFAAQATVVGLFLNNVTPSNLGQDVWRVLAVGSRFGRGSTGLATVGADRVVGLIGAALLPLLAFGPAAQAVGLTVSLEYTIVPLVVLLLGILLAGTKPARRWGAALFSIGPLQQIKQPVREVYDSFCDLMADRKRAGQALGYGIAFHLCVVLANYALAVGLGLAIPLLVCLVVVPLAVIVQAIPITINGLGIREGAYISLLGAAGVGGADAVALSLTFFGVWTAVSAGGAIPLLAQRRRACQPSSP